MPSVFDQLSHNSEEQIEADRDPGCDERAIGCNASMRQMSALTQLSQICRQLICFDYLSVPFEQHY
jgi:hypothetical protein